MFSPLFLVILRTILEKYQSMSRVCQITGKTAQSGNNVSHAMNKSKRKFLVNLFKKRYFMPEQESWITIKVSAHGMKIINKIGVEEAVKRAKTAGLIKEA